MHSARRFAHDVKRSTELPVFEELFDIYSPARRDYQASQ